MSTTLLLYKQIKALNREEHKGLRLRQGEDCAFAAGTHLVPLAGSEFFQAARNYSIVFVGEGDQAVPICMLGLTPGQNAFIDADNKWTANHYIPAFVRRYPFVLAQAEDEKFTVCIDGDFAGWNDSEGHVLFGEDGSNSDFLNETIRFLHNFTAEMERTRAFVARLNALGLLARRTLKLSQAGGEQFVLDDFQTVDEEKFRQLADSDVLALHKDGFLGWIYAHLMSLGNANQLFERHLAAKQAA